MKMSKTVKIVLVMMISFIMLFSARQVFATDSFTDITGTIEGNNTTTITEDEEAEDTTTGNKIKGNNNVLTTGNTSNTSNYNNSTLPKTGIEGTATAAIFVVVLGISAVYAYKKIQYYKNI
ncbi:MAG: LPXTG cell wall anchor domain-containing protein [Clostridia bacterium]|nr:LPXTG cell wall anchor domain-containing protein [Clostridia bacterium]